MTAAAQWSADPSKRTVGTLVLKGPNGGDVDLIANNSIRSGEIAAYIEMRDEVLVQAQTQLDEIAAGIGARALRPHGRRHPVTSGAQSGFDVDLGGLLNGNSVRLTYTDNVTGHAAHASRWCGSTIRPPCRCRIRQRTIRTIKVIGLDFSGGLASVVSQLTAALGSTGLQFSNPAGTTLRVLDDGGANNVDVNALSATSTVTSLTGGTPELPFFLDGTAAYTGAIGAARDRRRSDSPAASPSTPVSSPTARGWSCSRPRRRPQPAIRPGRTSSTTASTARRCRFLRSPASVRAATPFNGSLQSFMRQVISQQGEAAEAAENLKQGQDVVFNTLQQRFNDGAAVNIDQEMANLLEPAKCLRRQRPGPGDGEGHARHADEDVRTAMSISGIGSRSALGVQSLVEMRRQLDELQRQLGTGKKADTYAGIGLDRGLVVGLRNRLSALEGFNSTITNVNVRIDLAQSALGRIADIRRTVKSAAFQSARRSRAMARPSRRAQPIRAWARFSACSIPRSATATSSPAAPPISRRSRASSRSWTATAPARASGRS